MWSKARYSDAKIKIFSNSAARQLGKIAFEDFFSSFGANLTIKCIRFFLLTLYVYLWFPEVFEDEGGLAGGY